LSRGKSQPLVVDGLYRLVHPRDGHSKIFAMIDAYLDESGIHDGAAICVVAGYFGGRGQLGKLETAWKAVLSEYKFPMEDFHAKNLLKQRRHRPMLHDLAEAIAKQPKVYPVSFGVVVQDFNSFSLKQRRFFTGATVNRRTGKLVTTGAPTKSYFVPFQNCLKAVTEYAPVGGKAHFAFGIDRPFAEYAVSLFAQIKEQIAEGSYPDSAWKAKDRLGDPTFPEASKTAQLQAADLYVHLTYQHMIERRVTQDWKAQPPAELLALCLVNMKTREDHQFMDKECLEDVLAQSRADAGDWDSKIL
jgi:hypothetical protein